MKTILVTAAGSAAASAVVERLHAAGHRVVGCDIYPKAWNAASGEADVFFQAVPVADEEAYTAQLLEAVEKNGVSFLIPLTDVEVDVLCGAKPRFAALGCAVCTPETAAVRLCRDKRIMTERLSQSGICRTIPTFSPYGYEPKAEDFPMMLKPVSGRSSQGQTVVRTREAFFSALAARKDLIAQPYLAGDIYTVDVARDRMGHVQTLARREL